MPVLKKSAHDIHDLTACISMAAGLGSDVVAACACGIKKVTVTIMDRNGCHSHPNLETGG